MTDVHGSEIRRKPADMVVYTHYLYKFFTTGRWCDVRFVWKGAMSGAIPPGFVSKHILSMGFSGTPKDMGPPYGKRDPYYSHTTPIRIRKDMGIVWEAYHRGVPLLGVPRISLDLGLGRFCPC